MYSRPLVAVDFSVPQKIKGNSFHLRMLTIDDVSKDFAAVMDCVDWLQGFMNPNSDWPRGLTIDENLADLGWHQTEFKQRHSFAYTVMNDDESRCLGCCYIYPSDNSNFDAMAFYWARDKSLDCVLGEVFRENLQFWPFERIAFPGRDIAWDQWCA
jgi:hypothetical protein